MLSVAYLPLMLYIIVLIVTTLSVIKLCVIMLSATYAECYISALNAVCHCAEGHYAECCCADCHGAQIYTYDHNKYNSGKVFTKLHFLHSLQMRQIS